jgi:hypothetical protein
VWQLSHGALGYANYDDSLLVEANIPTQFRNAVAACIADIEEACRVEQAVLIFVSLSYCAAKADGVDNSV